MKDKYGDGTTTDEDMVADPKKKLDHEPKIIGFSLKNVSPFVKFLYFAAIIGIIGLGLFLAMKKLFDPAKSDYDKKREVVKAKKAKKSTWVW